MDKSTQQDVEKRIKLYENLTRELVQLQDSVFTTSSLLYEVKANAEHTLKLAEVSASFFMASQNFFPKPQVMEADEEEILEEVEEIEEKVLKKKRYSKN